MNESRVKSLDNGLLGSLWHRFCAAQIPILEELMSWVRTQRALRKQVREQEICSLTSVIIMGVKTCACPVLAGCSIQTPYLVS